MDNEIQNSIDARQNLMDFEKVLLSADESRKIDLPIKHYHANGVYCREMTIYKDVELSGAIHKYDHICILSLGQIEVFDEHEGLRTITAPHIWTSKAGVKRAIRAIEHSIMINCHKCDEVEEDKIWSVLVSNSYDDYALFLQQQNKLIEG